MAAAVTRPAFAMLTERRSDLCKTPPWWAAPVIVGGSGGSGTRGSAMLLEELGVGMACSSRDFFVTVGGCNLSQTACLHTSIDCSLLRQLRPRARELADRSGLSWFEKNGSHVDDAPCDAVSRSSLLDALTRPTNHCFGEQLQLGQALQFLREAVNPRYRRPWRWGLKNPHATYNVGAWRALYPCLVYVHTVRDLQLLVRGSKLFDHRVEEALAHGAIGPREAARLQEGRRGSAPAQTFLANYLWRVNTGLAGWLQRCAPEDSASLPLFRAVLVGGACLAEVVRRLAAALRLDEGETLRVARRFANASRAVVYKSQLESLRDNPLRAPSALQGWPLSLQPGACRAAITLKHVPKQQLATLQNLVRTRKL